VDPSAARHQVIRYDHRDTGRSTRAFDWRPYPFTALAEDSRIPVGEQPGMAPELLKCGCAPCGTGARRPSWTGGPGTPGTGAPAPPPPPPPRTTRGWSVRPAVHTAVPRSQQV